MDTTTKKVSEVTLLKKRIAYLKELQDNIHRGNGKICLVTGEINISIPRTKEVFDISCCRKRCHACDTGVYCENKKKCKECVKLTSEKKRVYHCDIHAVSRRNNLMKFYIPAMTNMLQLYKTLKSITRDDHDRFDYKSFLSQK